MMLPKINKNIYRWYFNFSIIVSNSIFEHSWEEVGLGIGIYLTLPLDIKQARINHL